MCESKNKTSGRGLGDFDDHADDYRSVHNEAIKFSGADSDYFSEQKIKVVREMEKDSGLRFLDFGCGDGNSARYFQKHFPHSKYVGLDTSERSVELARQAVSGGDAEFVGYDGTTMPFDAGLFDVVFAACVFHHIEHAAHESMLAEIKRVLRTGGRLYLFEHNPLNPLTRRVVNNCPFDEDAVLLKAGYTKELFRRSGFGEIEIDYTIFFPNHRIFRGLHFLERHLRWLPLGGQYFARAVKAE